MWRDNGGEADTFSLVFRAKTFSCLANLILPANSAGTGRRKEEKPRRPDASSLTGLTWVQLCQLTPVPRPGRQGTAGRQRDLRREVHL